MKLLFLFGLACAGCSSMEEGMSAATTEERIHQSPAWHDGRFRNLSPTEVMRPGKALSVFPRFILGGPDREPDHPLPTVLPNLAGSPPTDDIRVTWLGHSSLFIEIEGHSVLCDPHWSDRSSPLSFAGPRRFHSPALPLADLPDPDIVVISHDHYDHLDRATILALAARGSRFAVPLGVDAHLLSWGIDPSQILAHDWWERTEIAPGGLSIVSTPARHFSGRGPTDRNRTLWTSWVLEGPNRRVYFGGDGGLDPLFQEIGDRLGPFDLTLLEIGAFDESWGEIHLGPRNAVVAHRMLRGGVLMPIHWGTFNLGLHAWYEPPEQMVAAVEGTDIRLAMPRIGETFLLGGRLPDERWWKP